MGGGEGQGVEEIRESILNKFRLLLPRGFHFVDIIFNPFSCNLP